MTLRSSFGVLSEINLAHPCGPDSGDDAVMEQIGVGGRVLSMLGESAVVYAESSETAGRCRTNPYALVAIDDKGNKPPLVMSLAPALGNVSP